MNKKMRNLIGAAYYLTFILVVGYIFGNMAGVNMIDSVLRALSSAVLFVQHIIGQLLNSFNIGLWL